MPIQFIDQKSALSVFTPVDRETGEALPTETWSDKVWTTEFARALEMAGLTLTWHAAIVYHRHRAYAIPAGTHTFGADPAFATSVVIWLDPTSPDNLTVDLVLLDGASDPPTAPVTSDDVVRLAWGVIPAGASTFTLNALRHVEGL